MNCRDIHSTPMTGDMAYYDEQYNLGRHYLFEFKTMVEAAKTNLAGTCPLLEDEVLVKVYEYIKALEKTISNGRY
jgi:hypothetical protein